MITDEFLAEPFITHIPSDGSHIADGAPDPDTFTPLYGTPEDETALQVYMSGKPFAVCEVAYERPVCKNTGTLKLMFDVALDANAAKNLQGLETDVKVTIGGKTFNLSTYLNFEKGGLLQTSDASQGWIDTELKPGMLKPFELHSYDFLYAIDVNAGTCSYTDVYIDDKEYVFGTAQHGISGAVTGWADGAIFQLQLTLNGNGGEVAIAIKSAKLIWS